MYCIACQQEVLKPVHDVVIWVYPDEQELDWCDGNEGELITASPPPELPEYWEDDMIEPDEEFMELIENSCIL